MESSKTIDNKAAKFGSSKKQTKKTDKVLKRMARKKGRWYKY